MIKKSISLIDRISDNIVGIFNKYCNSDIRATLTICPYNYNAIDDSARCAQSTASTICTYYFDKFNVIYDIDAIIYVPVEQILRNLIDFDLNTEILIEYYDVIIRHEIGHIIHIKNSFIGSTTGEVEDMMDEVMNMESDMPKLRRNASLKSRINWIKNWFSLPAEKMANDLGGVSMDEIIRLETIKLRGVKAEKDVTN